MRKTVFPLLAVALLLSACMQKQTVPAGDTSMVAPTQLNLEQLNKDIDLDMDISQLSLSDLRVLQHAFAARQGYPLRDAYLRGLFETTTWYDTLMCNYDVSVDYDAVEQIADETWRDFYYRAAEASTALKYSKEEQAFIERLAARERALLKDNFNAGEGLRVNMRNLVNPLQLTSFDPDLQRQLSRNGFAIVPSTHAQLFHIYEQNDYSNFPNFVTTDLFLQLFHLYFDCLLRDIEQNGLDSLVTVYAQKMYTHMHALASQSDNEEVRRLAAHQAVSFSIACELLTGQPVGTPDEQAEARKEVAKVMKAENAFSDFIGEYQEVPFAYSLFRPRGHYTRNERLQRYFRGMMWLQSVPYGLDTPEQVKLAALTAHEQERNADATEAYRRIDEVLTFLMGRPDNLSLMQVQEELHRMALPIEQFLADETKMGELKRKLDETGDRQTHLRPKFLRTSRNKVCLLPQRFHPDAEVLQEMVDYETDPSLRPVPSGLDVMAAMGVAAAERLLKEEEQKWKGFEPMLTKVKQRMQATDWQESVATQWLSVLKSVHERGDQAPYFMLTPEWDLKCLNTSLASWAELKHDAILYAKQPMGAECGGGGVPEPVVKGYVEPNVAFWAKAVSLIGEVQQLLKKHRLHSEKMDYSTDALLEQAVFLHRLSQKEMAGEPLSDPENDQLEYIGATFEYISLELISEPDQHLDGWQDVQGADRNVALVADVYTANADNNPEKSVLYAAVGQADEIYVVVEIGGYLYLTRGAVFSYREFTEPIDKPRLTDEEWQQQLKDHPRQGVPQWMKPVVLPLKDIPVPNEEVFYSSGC